MLYYGDSSCNPHPAAPPNTWSMNSLGKHQASLVLQHPFSFLKTVLEVWTIFWQHHILKECRSLDWGSALPTSRSTDWQKDGYPLYFLIQIPGLCILMLSMEKTHFLNYTETQLHQGNYWQITTGFGLFFTQLHFT